MESDPRLSDREADIDRYVSGYRQNPQTANEWGWTDEVAVQSLTKVPWNDEAPADAPPSEGWGRRYLLPYNSL
jgi:hypothetical protein